MNRSTRSTATAATLSLLCAAACAGKQARTIEPGSPDEVAVSPGGTAVASTDDSFVLSRQPAKAGAEPQLLLPVHTGDKWWDFRASFLGVNEREVKERDNAMSEKEAPDKFWDSQTALEAVSVWSSLCNECHGGRRKVEEALAMPAPPKGWGKGDGLFFGKRRPFAEVFAIVYDGGPTRNNKRSEMPPWRGKIAREQVWAILYFLMYQSGGIGAPLPPSLNPRQSDEVRRALE
jgi:mono/diheme cytochrome c family protein